jgi:hypothetical protein
MSKLIIVGLIIVWGIVLLPDVLQRLSRTRRSDSIRSFSSQLSSLGRTNGNKRSHDNVIDLRTRSSLNRPVAAPRPTAPARLMSAPVTPTRPVGAPQRRPGPQPTGDGPRAVPSEVRRRRQEVLMTLGSAAVLTLLAAVAIGGPLLLLVHLFIDVLLVTYLVLLAQVTAVVAPAVARPREQSLAPLSPLDNLRSPAIDLRTGSVGDAVPVAARRIAN